MKRNYFYLSAIGLGLTLATACNNDKKVEKNTDTIVVEKNTTTTVKENTTTTTPAAQADPSTSVTIGAGGAAVSTKTTDVSVNKDSITFKKR